MAQFAAFLNISPWPIVPDWLFWAALALIGGGLLGEAGFRWLALPRIAGYGAAGIVVAAAGQGHGAGPLDGVTRLVVDLALALLLFELGSRVSLRWLRANPTLLWTSALESLASFVAIAVLLLALGYGLDAALMGAALIVSASGAVVGRVASELKTAGQVTERMIVFAALSTLYAVLLIKLLTGWVHVDARGDWVTGIAQPLFTLTGSILLAALLFAAVAWVMRRFDMANENTVLMLLGFIALALTVARMLNLSTLLVPLLAGVILRNASERPCIWPRHFGTAGGVLVLMLFVVVGASWSPGAVAAGMLVALAVLVVRGLAKAVVLVSMARPSGIRLKQGMALSFALAPVSATSLVLLADLQSTHADLAYRLTPLVSAAIAVMAIVGPIAVQWGLRLGGEHHPAPPPAAKERA